MYILGEYAQWNVKNCNGFTAIGDVLQLDATISNAGGTFCYAFPKETQVAITQQQDYEMSVRTKNIYSASGINHGHVGLLFNMVDEQNFDFVYLRYYTSRSK